MEIKLRHIVEQNMKQNPQQFMHHLSTNEDISYERLAQVSDQLAAKLAESDLPPKTRIAFMANNHWLFFPLLIACSIKDLVLVPLDPTLHTDELKSILEHSEVKLIIFDKSFELNVPAAIRTWTIDEALKFSNLSLVRPPQENDKEEKTSGKGAKELLLIYTSGTTGGTKAVKLSEQNLISMATSLSKFYKILPKDRFYCFMPLFHMNAIMMTGLVPLVSNAQVTLSEAFSAKNARSFWQDIAKYEVTVCSFIPSIMTLLLKIFPSGQGVATKVRFGFCGTAPLGADLWQKFEECFKFPVCQGYGLTETTCWAVATPLEGARRYDTVGVPLADCEIKIDTSKSFDSGDITYDRRQKARSSDSPKNEKPGQSAGEILIRGPVVMLGYYKDKVLTQNLTTPDKYFKTGDLGIIDEHGFLHVTGRIKEIIKRNGVNILSRDIDQVMGQHESVAECKTIGVSDQMVGERVHTVCVLKPDHTNSPEELSAWLNPKISDYKRPDRIVVAGYLPRTKTGKIAQNNLKRILSGEMATEIFENLTSWKTMRSKPSDPEGAKTRIQNSLNKGVPISFVSYWGCGTRATLGDVDRVSLDRMLEFIDGANKVSEVQARLTLIFTDNHVKSNGIPDDRARQYYGELKAYADQNSVECVYLSQIWKDHNLDPKLVHEAIKEEKFLKMWQNFGSKDKLIDQAEKHLEGSADIESAAKRYFWVCLTEAPVVKEKYSDCHFLTYNPQEWDILLPELPKYYIYSVKKGISKKPWFFDFDKVG